MPTKPDNSDDIALFGMTALAICAFALLAGGGVFSGPDLGLGDGFRDFWLEVPHAARPGPWPLAGLALVPTFAIV